MSMATENNFGVVMAFAKKSEDVVDSNELVNFL